MQKYGGPAKLLKWEKIQSELDYRKAPLITEWEINWKRSRLSTERTSQKVLVIIKVSDNKSQENGNRIAQQVYKYSKKKKKIEALLVFDWIELWSIRFPARELFPPKTNKQTIHLNSRVRWENFRGVIEIVEGIWGSFSLSRRLRHPYK